MKLERIVRFEPGYDRRAEGYGIHGVNLRMVLKGEKGAVQFLLFTNWMPDSVDADYPTLTPMPADFGYHAKVSQYDGQEMLDENCEFTGGPCYYAGSGLNAERIFRLLRHKGGEAAWGALEEYYGGIFGDE